MKTYNYKTRYYLNEDYKNHYEVKYYNNYNNALKYAIETMKKNRNENITLVIDDYINRSLANLHYNNTEKSIVVYENDNIGRSTKTTIYYLDN